MGGGGGPATYAEWEETAPTLHNMDLGFRVYGTSTHVYQGLIVVGGGLGFRLEVGPRGCRDDIEH